MEIVIVLHGSRDPDYVKSVEEFARSVSVRYAFKELARPLIHEVPGDVYLVLFVGYGGDYEDAVNKVGYATPPLLEWPGFVELISSLKPELVVLHGNNYKRFHEEVRGLISGGLNVAFLEVEPSVSTVLRSHCPTRILPLVLTRGVIYRRITREVREYCPSTELLPPLFELGVFREYFLGMLNWVLRSISWQVDPQVDQ